MTDLLTRPARAAPAGADARGTQRPPWFVVLVSAAWAAGIGLAVVTVVVLLAWSTDAASTSGAAGALHASGQAWLLAHGVPLEVPGGRLGIVPLGAVLLPGLLLWRAGATVAGAADVSDLRAAATFTAALSAAYGGVAAVVAALATTPDVHAAPARALAGAMTLALFAGGAGVVGASHLGGGLVGLVPPWARPLLHAAAAGLLVLAMAGAVLAGVSLAWHAGRSAELSRALAPGAVGGVGLFAISLVLLPNAVVWASCYAVGPGFAVGADSSVAPFGVSLGSVPAIPLMSALPASGAAPPVAMLSLLAPLAAGAVIGAIAVRRLPAAGRRTATLAAAASGAGAGIALGLAAWWAGGSLGPGRLAVAGPSPWRVALAAGCELAVVAAAVTWWRWRPDRLSG